MGKRKVDGKGQLHVNVPVALWEKLRVMSQLSTSVVNSSELAQVAMDAFVGISRALDANGFAAVERQRNKNEAWQSVMLFADETTVDAAKSEADRLGVSVSSWVTAAVSAMTSDVNPMIYDAPQRDFAQTVRLQFAARDFIATRHRHCEELFDNVYVGSIVYATPLLFIFYASAESVG